MSSGSSAGRAFIPTSGSRAPMGLAAGCCPAAEAESARTRAKKAPASRVLMVLSSRVTLRLRGEGGPIGPRFIGERGLASRSPGGSAGAPAESEVAGEARDERPGQDAQAGRVRVGRVPLLG